MSGVSACIATIDGLAVHRDRRRRSAVGSAFRFCLSACWRDRDGSFVLRLPMTAPVLHLLGRVDAFLGASAGALVIAGLSRVFFGLKDESYYFASHAFAAKMAVVI